MGNDQVKKTLRCRDCGADHTGGVCKHCGCDVFVDVSRFYDAEVLEHYAKQRAAVEL
jgi:hypothetical protein